MDVIQFPDDITVISPDELEKLETAVNGRGEELADSDPTEETVNELEKLASYADAIEGEKNRRGEEAAALNQRAQEASGRFRPQATDAPEEGETPETPDEPEKPAEDEEDEQPIVEAIAAAVSGAVKDALASSRTLVAAGTQRGMRGDAKALTERQPGVSKPRTSRSTMGFMAATSHVTSMKEGTPFEDPMAVAEAITRKRHSFTSSPTGTRDMLPIAHADKEFETSIGHDAVDNFEILRTLQIGAKALVASGGACAEFAPSYEFFRLAEPQNPVEQGLQVVQAPRGGINYIVPPSVAAAAGAIDISAQDRDYTASFVQFSAGPKACISVTCPSTQSAEVSAVSQCVTFDNLNYKVFPEQVSAFLEDVAVQFTSAKEVFYLDYINSQSTAVTATYPYGFSRSLLHDWVTAAVGYRKRHGMLPEAPLTVMAPDWAREAAKLDVSLDGQEGLSMWPVSDQQLDGALSAANLSVIWYNDNVTGLTPNQKFNAAQNAGALNQFPTQIYAFIFAPGTFIRLDGGTLDVGLVRDSVLNRTNDLQLFMEEWIGAAKLGFESIRLRSTLCVNGAGPAGVTAHTC